MDTLAIDVGKPQSCGLRKTALEFVQKDEPRDAAVLGTRKCVLYARVAELADALDSKSSVLADVWVRVPPWAPVASVNDVDTE